MQGGTNAPSITLELAAEKPLNSLYPIAMMPRGDLSDLEPSVRKQLQSGHPGGTLLIWPIETRIGWPLRCVRYWNDGVYGWGSFFYGIGPRPQMVVGGVTISKGPRPFDGKVVPYEPIAGGLVVDALVWGGMVMSVWWLASSVRRWRRRAAGRCVACGYELVGVVGGVCPECGVESGLIARKEALRRE